MACLALCLGSVTAASAAATPTATWLNVETYSLSQPTNFEAYFDTSDSTRWISKICLKLNGYALTGSASFSNSVSSNFNLTATSDGCYQVTDKNQELSKVSFNMDLTARTGDQVFDVISWDNMGLSSTHAVLRVSYPYGDVTQSASLGIMTFEATSDGIAVTQYRTNVATRPASFCYLLIDGSQFGFTTECSGSFFSYNVTKYDLDPGFYEVEYIEEYIDGTQETNSESHQFSFPSPSVTCYTGAGKKATFRQAYCPKGWSSKKPLPASSKVVSTKKTTCVKGLLRKVVTGSCPSGYKPLS